MRPLALTGASSPSGDVRRACDVMRPVNSKMFVPDNATIESAIELVEQNQIGAVAVVNQTGELIGFLRKGNLKRKS